MQMYIGHSYKFRGNGIGQPINRLQHVKLGMVIWFWPPI